MHIVAGDARSVLPIASWMRHWHADYDACADVVVDFGERHPLEHARKPPSTRLAAVIMVIGLSISTIHAVSLISGSGDGPVVAKNKRKDVQQEGTAQPDNFDPQRDYDQRRTSDELRAYHGAIFFAHVDSLAGEHVEPTAEGVPPHRLLTYLVTVDRSLAGNADGQVPIIYFGAYENSFESAGFGPLRIGERYLFFAGGDKGGTEYYVQAGSGTILITSDRQEEHLVKKYLPLIAEADRHEQEAIARATARAEARNERAEPTPIPAVNAEQGAPGNGATPVSPSR
jgi:hypothetical protein